MAKLTYKEYLSIALILAVIGVLGVLWQKPWLAGASVEVGNAYTSTTTPTLADLTNLCPAGVGFASSTTGTLGSVVVTGGNTGKLDILNASTSNVNLRTGNKATSSLYLASFPILATTTTYTFDIEFTNGLLVDYTTAAASTTITYRCGQ